MLVPVYVIDEKGVGPIYDMQGVRYNNPAMARRMIAAVDENNPAIGCKLFLADPTFDNERLEREIARCNSQQPPVGGKQLRLDSTKISIDSTKISIDATHI